MTNPLITAEELRVALQGPRPPVLLDARWYLTEPERGSAEYSAGHLPGAWFVSVETDLSAPVREDRIGGRHPLPEPERVQALIDRVGVRSDRPVVVLDQGSSLGAARAWWVLRDAGVPEVRVLDGGHAAWLAAGGEVTDEVPSHDRVPDELTLTVDQGQLDQVDSAQLELDAEDGATVVDVRAAERFTGEVEPMDPVAGHIPGAVNIPASRVAGPQGFAPAEEIREALAGLAEGDILSCGSGITAAQVLLAAESAGIEGLRIYPGSFSDWVSDPERPVATGA